LPKDQYVIYGSSCLAIRGIRESNDLDLLVTPNIFKELLKKYPLVDNKKIEINNIEIFDNFNYYYEDLNIFFKDVDFIQGYPFLNLNLVLDIKKRMNREKDLKDIKLIEEYLKK